MRSLILSILVAVPLSLSFAVDTWGAFTFSPVKLNLKPGKTAVALTVTNTGGKPLLMQVETFRWDQKGGVDVVAATDELLAVPPVFTIPAGKSQIVRIALPNWKPADKETTYRVLLAELPEKEKKLDKSMVSIAMRVSLPFFAKPQKMRQALEWDARSAGQNRVALTLSNSGNVHTQIRKIAILSHPDRKPLAPEKTESFYVLSDQKRSLTVDLEKPSTPNLVVVFEDVDQGSQEVVLELDKGHVLKPAASAPP